MTSIKLNDRREKNNGNLRLGEKTAGEISKLYAENSNNDDWVPKQNPFINYSQHQRKPKSSYTEHPKRESHPVTSHAPTAFGPNRNEGGHESNRVPKMVGESLLNIHTKLHGKLENVQLNNSYVRDPIKNLQNIDTENITSSGVSNISAANYHDLVAGESNIISQLSTTNDGTLHKKEDNSIVDDVTFNNATEAKFKLKQHNIDDDGHTWRPMKINPSGDMTAASSVLLHKDGKSVHVDTSNSWIPNSGPVLKSRD